jgi:hypothetical protein
MATKKKETAEKVSVTDTGYPHPEIIVRTPAEAARDVVETPPASGVDRRVQAAPMIESPMPAEVENTGDPKGLPIAEDTSSDEYYTQAIESNEIDYKQVKEVTPDGEELKK